MPAEKRQPIQVECRDCGYTRTVLPTDDELPADIIVDHGRKTGHKLMAKRVESGKGQLSQD